MGAMWHATWDWRRGVLAAEESMILGGHGLHCGGEGGRSPLGDGQDNAYHARDGEISCLMPPSVFSSQQLSVGSGFCTLPRAEQSHRDYRSS